MNRSVPGQAPLRPAERLGGLLLSSRDPKLAVSFSGDGAAPQRRRSFGEWRTDVLRLDERLAARVPVAGARFALYDDDPYAFSVGLFGLWQAGCVAVLPPNAQPGTLERLRDAVEGAVGGSGAWLPGRSGLAIEVGSPTSAGGPAPIASLRALEADAPVLELFTSGTTGEGKAVPKLLRHLDDEVQCLDRLFGDELGAAPVFATASHQHLYGLLFRVLWPLASARPFCADRVLHGEELFSRLGVRAALASVPAHLDRLAERALCGAAGEPPLVFSSGGPLSAATAHAWERATGDAPVEIFGSTETGGVAWRRQRSREADVPWTPFDVVRVGASAPDDRLGVRSPFVSVGDDSLGEGSAVSPGAGRQLVFRMGDRVRLLPDGRFEVCGRADRVLKIGEKRLSLPDMESRLRTHPLVADVALVGVELAGQTRVGAVAVLTDPGRAQLEAEGRRALGRALATHLARDFDRILVPRAWRYAEELPRDAQGKTTTARLRALFDPGRGPGRNAAGNAPVEPVERIERTEPGEGVEARVTQPQVLEDERGDEFALQRCRVPTDLAHLDGHFPGAPIVAGVVQLGWAVDLASKLVPGGVDPERVEALKFALPLEPATEFMLRVDVDRAAAIVRFRLFDTAGEFSSGRLRLRGVEAVVGAGREAS